MNKHSTTPKQQKTLEFIKDYQTKFSTRPTHLEIGQHLGVSAAAAQNKVDSLIRKKIISLDGIYKFSSKEL